jgi:hypothetical protein
LTQLNNWDFFWGKKEIVVGIRLIFRKVQQFFNITKLQNKNPEV